MKTHADDKTPRTSNKFSTVDWPSAETLMAARRARAHALRDMTLALCRSLKSLALRSLAAVRSGRARPAQPAPAALPRAARESLARAWVKN